MTNQYWWNYSIEELEQMADENGKITKDAMEKFNKEMTEDNEQEHKY
jgi:predicted ATP-grasp superfamily ATP-dependent carboligase|tara:strand:+ start:741 stop:881 length:141 start_codon:yes stop_codon:yes gene_type:complete